MATPTPTLIDRIRTERGRQFEQAVSDAFNSLGLSSSLTASTEAESDVIVEALLPESTYFAVVECCAADEGSEVGYAKLGQLRGSFMKYTTDDRRQKMKFATAYKAVVGKPRFSSHAIESASPDVSLISGDILTEFLKLHSKYRFSPEELENVFKVSGEVKGEHLNVIASLYQRKISIYALICLALLFDPYSNSDRRKPYTSAEQVVGSVSTLSNLLQIEYADDDMIRECLRDLQTPFLKLLQIRDGMIRLSSVPLSQVSSYAGELGAELLSQLQGYRQRLEHMRNTQT